MSLITHAQNELALAWPEQDEMQDAIKADVLALVELFATQGHSGMSAPYVLQLFNKLAKFEPITPLTGGKDEWVEVDTNIFQNIRCGAIFKEGEDGTAYWLGGVVFRDQHGGCFTNSYSRTPVNFPYTPKQPTYVDIYVKDEV